MNWLKRYLEKKKLEKQQRSQEKFLNTRIPLNELIDCEMYKCIAVKYEGESFWNISKHKKANFDSNMILRKFKGKDGYNYIDPITNIKYRNFSDYRVEIDDLVVGNTKKIKFSEEAIKRRYVTIADLIEFKKTNNEVINEN